MKRAIPILSNYKFSHTFYWSQSRANTTSYVRQMTRQVLVVLVYLEYCTVASC